MGQYLSAPVTEKEVKEGHNDKLAYGLAAMQGWRVAMEDDHVSALNFHDNISVFSVFDGHGGRAVARYAAKHLLPEMQKLEAFKQGDLAKAITDAYFQLDVLLETEEGIAELRELSGQSKPAEKPESKLKGLFSTVEDTLSSEDTPATGADDAADTASGPRKASKTESSSKFYDSHLKRVSLDLTPYDDIPNEGDRDAAAGSTTQNTEPAATSTPNGDSELPDGEETDDVDEMRGAMGVGCTAVTAVIRENLLIVANTGDSRCVLSKKGVAVPLTLDHKPILLEEAQRIVKAGGFVRDNRVNGALNVSRTLGDLDFKKNDALPHTEQMVVATPDIEILELMDGDEFLIIACDGIWDVLSNQEAVEFVRKRIKQGMKLRQICEQMCDYCLAPDLKGLCRGADNMSVIIVLFRKTAHLDSLMSRIWGSSLRMLGMGNSSSSKKSLRY